MRRLLIESEEPDLQMIDLSNIPGGAEIFEFITKFCYGVNFQININNIAALHCAAVYLEMTDQYCDKNLVTRTHGFLTRVALTSLSGAISVLKSCENLLPLAEELNMVQQCVNVITTKACNETKFPSGSRTNWWAEELSNVHISFFIKVIETMTSRGVQELVIAEAITTYAKRTLLDSAPPDSVNGKRDVLDSLVALLPAETQQPFYSTNFLCRLLRTAIFLKNDDDCKKQLENRILALIEQITVDDLLTLSYKLDEQRLLVLESVTRIVTRFVEKEMTVSIFNTSDYNHVSSPSIIKVAKTVDSYLLEIAKATELTISQFNEIANLMPKNVREVEDDLYLAIDVYLQNHPNLGEIEREKVCSAMDPLKLSAETRLHASQNKNLPLQIVLHTLYYDQLQVRSGQSTPIAQSMRHQVQADVALTKENEELRNELLAMKMYISDMEKKKAGTSSAKLKKPTLFSSITKTFGRLNPFKQVSKDTLSIDDGIDRTKPRRRRFSLS
ncbi:root phototropism protein 2-like [Rutidosis leptorrhynchoides]|uniref:root phototropism protein 2-like n=1 Tax=Rutidosis leptorrhynchoides TaxID=125765 RepID=UPI003A996D9D